MKKLREIAGLAWLGAANAFRMYPDNKHTFTEYWTGAKSLFDEFGWHLLTEEQPEYGKEVMAYHPEWEDPDYNPDGVRVGFLQDGDPDHFHCAKWCNIHDTYENGTELMPTHWMDKPEKP